MERGPLNRRQYVILFSLKAAPLIQPPGKFLYDNYKQALEIIREYTPQLDAYFELTGVTGADMEAWIQEELQYLKDVTAEEPVTPWKIAYVKALQELAFLWTEYESASEIEFHSYTAADFTKTGALPADKELRQQEACRAKIHAQLLEKVVEVEEIEEREGLMQRWQPVDREFKDTERFLDKKGFAAAVDNLEGRVVQRLLELSKANLAGTSELSSLSV